MSGAAAAPLSTFYLQTTPIWRDYQQFSPGQSVIHFQREIKLNKMIQKFIKSHNKWRFTFKYNMQLRHRSHLIPDIGLTLYSRHRASGATLIVLYFLFCEPRRNQFLLSGGSKKFIVISMFMAMLKFYLLITVNCYF